MEPSKTSRNIKLLATQVSNTKRDHMSAKTCKLIESEKRSEIIRNLYVALFTKNALSNACMNLTMHYMDADRSKVDPNWEGTAAFSLLAAVTWLNSMKTRELIEDSGALNAFSDFVQSGMNAFFETHAKGVGLNAKWLPEILAKCQELARQGCLDAMENTNHDTDARQGVTALTTDVYESMLTNRLRSVVTLDSVSRAFTLKAIELFTNQMQLMHLEANVGKTSFFEGFKEFTPLLWVAGTVYDLTPDRDIVSTDDLACFITLIRRQFSATDELSLEAMKRCNQMLEKCLDESEIAVMLILP
jgi:hypothetical protein